MTRGRGVSPSRGSGVSHTARVGRPIRALSRCRTVGFGRQHPTIGSRTIHHVRVFTFLWSVMGDSARLLPSSPPCRADTTGPGRHGWLCDGAHAPAAARRLCLCRRRLGVVAAQQAPNQGSPASPRSSTPLHQRAFSNMAVVCSRRQTPPPRQRLPSRRAGALPGTSANALTHMPFAPRCADVRGGWHSACTESMGEPGAWEPRPTLPSEQERGSGDPTTRVAAVAEEACGRRRTHWG